MRERQGRRWHYCRAGRHGAAIQHARLREVDGGRAPDVCHRHGAGRLATHRQLRGAVRGGPRMEAAYIVLPPGAGGKSMAVAIEKQAILALQARTMRHCEGETFRSRMRTCTACPQPCAMVPDAMCE